MVQFNLLPDVKLDYVKTRRTKRMVMLASFTAIGLAIFVMVLMFLIVNVFQKQHISNLDQDIATKTKQLEGVPDLDKVLTIQNQLSSLTSLHEQKSSTSRLFGYLVQLTPQDAKISDVTMDMETGTMSIEGSAGRLETINRFVDTLKFTNYNDGATTDKAFTEVVLSSFGVSDSNANDNTRTSYSIQFKYNQAIFDNTKTVALVVPNIISTRSVVESPSDLFEAKINSDDNSGGTN